MRCDVVVEVTFVATGALDPKVWLNPDSDPAGTSMAMILDPKLFGFSQPRQSVAQHGH